MKTFNLMLLMTLLTSTSSFADHSNWKWSCLAKCVKFIEVPNAHTTFGSEEYRNKLLAKYQAVGRSRYSKENAFNAMMEKCDNKHPTLESELLHKVSLYTVRNGRSYYISNDSVLATLENSCFPNK